MGIFCMDKNNQRIISHDAQKSKHLSEVLKPLINYYQTDLRKIVQLCYKRGITQQDIANCLGVTKQAVCTRFPKKKLQPRTYYASSGAEVFSVKGGDLAHG